MQEVAYACCGGSRSNERHEGRDHKTFYGVTSRQVDPKQLGSTPYQLYPVVPSLARLLNLPVHRLYSPVLSAHDSVCSLKRLAVDQQQRIPANCNRIYVGDGAPLLLDPLLNKQSESVGWAPGGAIYQVLHLVLERFAPQVCDGTLLSPLERLGQEHTRDG